MDQEHLDRIEEDYMYLSVCMRENIKRLVKYLVEKNIINSTQEEDILDEASDTLKSQTLLDYLLEKDETAFSNFYEGCLHSHMWKAADILEPEKGPHQPREEDIEEFLPENWPTESHFDVIKDPQTLRIKRIGPRHTQMMSVFEESTKPETDGDRDRDRSAYNMSQKVKGRVLIINNEHFHNLPERTGSHYDRAGLDYVFSQLSFEIRVEQDLTAEKMRVILKDEAYAKDHSPYNCFVLAILSYGHGSRHVLGTDGKVLSDGKIENCIELEEIRDIFGKVPHLANKPKVFLIEAEPSKPGQPQTVAARRRLNVGASQTPSGGTETNGQPSTIKSDGTVSADSILAHLQMKELQSTSMNKTLSDGFWDGLGETEADDPLSSSGSVVKIAPSRGDMFTAMATFKERLMHDGKPCGSWFVQAFIYVLANYAHQNDLQMLIQKLNDLTVQQKGLKAVQVCATVSTLNKKLYFFPGLPIEA